MPNAKVLSEKQAIVAELTEKIQKATAGVTSTTRVLPLRKTPLCVRSAVRAAWIMRL